MKLHLLLKLQIQIEKGVQKISSARDLKEQPPRKLSNSSVNSQGFSEIQFEIGPTNDNFVMIFDELDANQQNFIKEEQNLKEILYDESIQSNKKKIQQVVLKSKWQKLQNHLKQEQILFDSGIHQLGINK